MSWPRRQQARAGVVRQHRHGAGVDGLGDEVGPVPARAGQGDVQVAGRTDREFREIPVTGTEPDAPGTATPIASPMAASGTAATAVGRKPWVESWPDGAAEAPGAL